MEMTRSYAAEAISRADVNHLPGSTLLEFGAPWCGHCQIAQPMLAQVLDAMPPLRHLKIEDGKGQPLGRSFGVRQWPTMILLIDGVEIARLTRPGSVKAIAEMLAPLAATEKR